MELYKIVIEGMKKRFYESTRTFETNWQSYIRNYGQFYNMFAYEIDFRNRCWKEIRRYNARS